MPTPSYRLATIEDLAQLVELRMLMQQEVNDTQDSEISPDYSDVVRQYFSHSMSDGSYISSVAELNGQLISATGIVVYSKPPSIRGGTGREGYIINVYTLPQWRKRGIATELMKVLVKYSRDNAVDRIHLTATDSGKGIYEAIGFKPPRFAPLELRL